MVIDTLAWIEQIRRQQPGSLPRLIEAVQIYGRGVALAKQGDFNQALPALKRAQSRLTKLRSPLAGWATYWMAVCHYQHSKYDMASGELRPLTQERYRNHYPALHGRSLLLEGLIQIIQGDPTTSTTAYQSALADFRKLGESANAARTAALLALNLDYLGRRDEAWRELYPALIEPTALENPAARQIINLVAAWVSLQEGEKEIALWFQEELVQNALDLEMAQGIVEALRGHSEILVTLGDRAGAVKDLDLAKHYLAQVSDPASREVLDGDIKLAEARLAGSPQQALDLLDDVIRIFRSSSYHYRLAQALHARARALDALGRSDDAERDLTAAIAEFELQRENIDLLEQRISYFDRTREILDTMIQLQIERRRQPAAAFGYSERARARVLLDWVLAQPAGRLVPVQIRLAGPPTSDPAAFQRRIPGGTAIVEYWTLPQSLVIWVLRQDDFQMQSVPIGRKALEALVQRLAGEIAQGRRAEFLVTTSRLYDLLIQPVARHLKPSDRIVTVPDGALHALPFALLRNGRTGKYLIENHICSVAPSARILLTSLLRDAELASPQNPRALVISDPAFDRQLFASLPRLRSRKEAIFARIFPGSRVLKNQAATRGVFLNAAGQFEIIHFGGHSLVNAEYPLLSQLLFAADPNDRTRGVLFSGDILGQRFERTRLVVLASCSTAAGKISRTEGVESLARPFLATGVPAVVASLWDVDDELTTEFFDRFYGHLRQTFDPAAALQKAQIESLKQGSDEEADPRSWGAFELLGGSIAKR